MSTKQLQNSETVAAMCCLDGLHIGQRATVCRVECPNRELRNKLLSLGLVEGACVEFDGVAPLGDPIRIGLLGSKVALRRCEAAHVLVQKVD